MDGPHYESRVERIIREAHEAGEFDDIRGRGEPIPSLARHYEPTWWARAWVERERRNDAVTELTSKLRRELPRLLAGCDAEATRNGVDGFNEAIAAVNDRLPVDQRLPLLDIDNLPPERH